MNFNQYKKNKSMQDAYRESVKIQENFALTSISAGGTFAKPYEGHIAVSDIISKIDATTRMFESYMKDDSFAESIPKIINIIDNLYELAQVKLTEAKNKAIEYMQRASGVESELGSDIDVDSEQELGPQDFQQSSPSLMNKNSSYGNENNMKNGSKNIVNIPYIKPKNGKSNGNMKDPYMKL